MVKGNQETVTTFAEVRSSANITYSQQNRPVLSDTRPVIYFQGMKVYIPDDFHTETLLKLLQVMKRL